MLVCNIRSCLESPLLHEANSMVNHKFRLKATKKTSIGSKVVAEKLMTFFADQTAATDSFALQLCLSQGFPQSVPDNIVWSFLLQASNEGSQDAALGTRALSQGALHINVYQAAVLFTRRALQSKPVIPRALDNTEKMLNRPPQCQICVISSSTSLCYQRNNPICVLLSKHSPIAFMELGLLAPEPNVGPPDCCNCLAR